jgi:AcrB/AcrD/AcrF family
LLLPRIVFSLVVWRPQHEVPLAKQAPVPTVIKFKARSLKFFISGEGWYLDAFTYDDHRVLFRVLLGVADRPLLTLITCVGFAVGNDLPVRSPQHIRVLRRVAEPCREFVMLSVPFALVGGFWLMWWLGFNLSVAVAVGFIALAGVAAETGVVMLIYLDSAMKELKERRAEEGRPFTRDDLYAAIMSGAVERVRPKMMTVAAIMAGLLPRTRCLDPYPDCP